MNGIQNLTKTLLQLIKEKKSATALNLIESNFAKKMPELHNKTVTAKDTMHFNETESGHDEEITGKNLSLLHTVLESSEIINIFAVDLQYNYIAFSQAHKKIMNNIYGVEIEIGQNSLNLITNHKDRLRVQSNIDRVFKGESYTLIEKFGDENMIRTYFEGYHSPVKDAFGNITGAVLFIIDATERNIAAEALAQSEKKLKESEEKYRLLAENAFDGIIHIDKDGIIQYASPAFAKIYGIEAIQYTLKSYVVLFEKIHPADKTALITLVTNAIQKHKERLTYTYRIQENNGMYKWLEDNAHFQYDNEGNYKGLYVNCRDITDRKKIELKLHESLKKAEAGNRLKTAFIQNISHEIRTPLNGILGFSELICDPDVSLPEKENFSLLLKKSSDRLICTIDDFMDISMIESENVEVRMSTQTIRHLIHETNVKYQESCEMKNLKYQTIFPEDYENIELTTDFELLTKCLGHVLDNALKFTNTGSITFGINILPHQLEFFVKDTGIGIAPGVNELIFKPFEQESQESTRGFEGNGLGLAIARAFLHLLGGDIRFESKKEAGTTFYLTLPYDQKSQLTSENKSSLSSRCDSQLPVILLAEDDLMSDIYMETLLRPVSSAIYKAANGQLAIDLCAQHPEISLVFMDLKMPVVNGFEATRQIKKLRNNLIVIATSAYALSEDKKKAFETGVDDFLSKPVGKAELYDKIRKFGFEV